jgi:hypothetical protein
MKTSLKHVLKFKNLSKNILHARKDMFYEHMKFEVQTHIHFGGEKKISMNTDVLLFVTIHSQILFSNLTREFIFLT